MVLSSILIIFKVKIHLIPQGIRAVYPWLNRVKSQHKLEKKKINHSYFKLVSLFSLLKKNVEIKTLGTKATKYGILRYVWCSESSDAV
jgi:hypothetical protein